MKRHFIYTLFLFLIVSLINLNAQVFVGATGGLNLADLRTEDETESVTKWGAGVSLQYYVADNIAVQAEPMYIQKGGVLLRTDNNPRMEVDMSFIEIPLLFRYEFGGNERFYLLAGPAFAFTQTSELSGDVNGIEFEADIEHLTESFELNLTGGAGLSIPLAAGKLFFEARYTHGLTDMVRDGKFTARAGHLEIDGFVDTDGEDNKTFGFQVFAGFVFPI